MCISACSAAWIKSPSKQRLACQRSKLAIRVLNCVLIIFRTFHTFLNTTTYNRFRGLFILSTLYLLLSVCACVINKKWPELKSDACDSFINKNKAHTFFRMHHVRARDCEYLIVIGQIQMPVRLIKFIQSTCYLILCRWARLSLFPVFTTVSL